MRILILSLEDNYFCYIFLMIIAQRIKELRTENGLTQKCLAERVNCNQSMIARWENGECEPTASSIVKLADVFRCTCDYLLCKDDY